MLPTRIIYVHTELKIIYLYVCFLVLIRINFRMTVENIHENIKMKSIGDEWPIIIKIVISS